MKFSSGGYKIRKILAKESTYPKEIIEFWINGKLSKIGHHFSNEKRIRKIRMISIEHRKLTLNFIFDSLPLIQNSKFNNFLWVC